MTSPSRAYAFCQTQLEAALSRYVEDGPATLRALRQQDADAVLAFLGSEAARKLVVQPSRGEP